MPHRRRLIPLLTAVLMIQSLVAVVPHTHHPTVAGRAWGALSAVDSNHRCLACSVHAPVVEPAAESGLAATAAVVSAVLVVDGSSDTLSTLSPAHSRGPPTVV